MDPHADNADTTGGWIIDRDEFLKLDRGQKTCILWSLFNHHSWCCCCLCLRRCFCHRCCCCCLCYGVVNKKVFHKSEEKCTKKSEQYRGPRRCGWAGAVSVGQGQYRVGKGSIGCSTTQVRFSAYQKSFLKMLKNQSASFSPFSKIVYHFQTLVIFKGTWTWILLWFSECLQTFLHLILRLSDIGSVSGPSSFFLLTSGDRTNVSYPCHRDPQSICNFFMR